MSVLEERFRLPCKAELSEKYGIPDESPVLGECQFIKKEYFVDKLMKNDIIKSDTLYKSVTLFSNYRNFL